MIKEINLQNETLTIVRGNSKRAQDMICLYNRSSNESIYDAYVRPSTCKERAYYDCVKLREKFEGYDGKVCGVNCDFFSYAFKLPRGTTSDEGFDLSGAIIYITASNNYIIL